MCVGENLLQKSLGTEQSAQCTHTRFFDLQLILLIQATKSESLQSHLFQELMKIFMIKSKMWKETLQCGFKRQHFSG